MLRRLSQVLMVAAIACALFTGSARATQGGPLAHASIGFQPTSVPLATDAAGHVFLMNPDSSQIQEHSAGGKLLGSFGSFGSFGGEFRSIAVDAAGHLWVADLEAGKVTELGGDGTVLQSWPAESGAGMTIDPAGDVFLLGPKEEVGRYSAAGDLITRWALPKRSGQPFGIAAGPDGLLYVAGPSGDRVLVYEPTGILVREWKTAATPGYTGLPYGIAVAPSGDVYLADTGADRVEEFTATGTPVRAWGSSGGAPGRFDTPTGIAVGAGGDVYVADEAIEYPGTGTARVQRFTAEGAFLNEWGYVPKPRPAPSRITDGPPKRTSKNVATFSFSSRQRHATFACRLSGHSVAPRLARRRACTSPRRYAHLSPGRKVFEVRAVVGGRESRAARYVWTVLPRVPR